MRKCIVILLFLSILTGCVKDKNSNIPSESVTSQPTNNKINSKSIENTELQNLINEIIPKGKQKVFILEEAIGKSLENKSQDRLKDISSKISNNDIDSKMKMVEIIRMIRNGQEVQYDIDSGLTKDEFNEFVMIQKEMKIVKLDTTYNKIDEGRVEINYSNNILELVPLENIKSIDEVYIDFNSNHARVNGEILSKFKKAEPKENSTDKIKGYTWYYTDANDISVVSDSTKDSIVITLTIGKYVKSDETIISYFKSVIKDGEITSVSEQFSFPK